MGKELVVREVLSEQMIDAGAKLVERLDQLQSDELECFRFSLI